jgi:hypothetical protein
VDAGLLLQSDSLPEGLEQRMREVPHHPLRAMVRSNSSLCISPLMAGQGGHDRQGVSWPLKGPGVRNGELLVPPQSDNRSPVWPGLPVRALFDRKGMRLPLRRGNSQAETQQAVCVKFGN